MSFDFPRTAFVEAILRELESTPLILVCGPRGGGKSWLLRRFAREYRCLEPGVPIALVQLEPVSSSPEVLHRELARIAGPALGKPRGSAAHYSFDGLLDALQRRPKDSLLLLDDVTEIRTLSYYPSVETPLDTFLDALKKGGRALLTSRFSYWMERRFPELPLRRLPPLSSDELEQAGAPEPEAVARATAGLAVHAARLAETLEETTSVVARGSTTPSLPSFPPEAGSKRNAGPLSPSSCTGLGAMAPARACSTSSPRRKDSSSPRSRVDSIARRARPATTSGGSKRSTSSSRGRNASSTWTLCFVSGCGSMAEASRRAKTASVMRSSSICSESFPRAGPRGETNTRIRIRIRIRIRVESETESGFTLPPPPSEDFVEID